MIGSTLGHYRVLQKLGEGGMGVVYKAHDEQLDRDVAIKVLPAGTFRDAAARARLLREARSAAALNHPNICTIHEVGEAEGQVYIAMELVEGEPLSARLARGPLLTDDVLRYGLQLAGALAHAHERNLIHRDLKSANVIITPDGRAKILDFGLAKRLAGEELAEAATQSGTDATLTRPGALVGTLAYMAPEQLRGQAADARSDIWALGIVLHEMAGGGRPFHGTTGFDLSSAILTQPPAPLPEKVAPELRAVIQRCLEKEPASRYQRAGEVRAALEAVQSGTAILPVASRPLPRRWLLAMAAIVLLALCALLVAWNVGGLRDRLLGRSGGPVQSIAVLPLENLSRDAEQDYLAEGLQEELITDLSTMGGFKKVVARGSTMQFRGSKKPLREIARALGVDALVTGAVLRSGDRVRVTAHLINAKTEEALWDQKYEREYRDILNVQNEIVSAIAQGVKLRLSPQQQAQLARARTVNPQAHEAYLKGMFYMNKGTPEAFQKGVALLQEAVEKDPGNALPYATLALAYDTIGHAPAAPPDALPKAKQFALKALELDPTVAEGHAALAMVKVYSDRDWDWEGAGRAYRRALELNPNLAEAHGHYGWYLLLYGRREEAFAEMKRAQEISPLDPQMIVWVGETYAQMGVGPSRRDQLTIGIAQFRKALELDPNFPTALSGLGRAYADMGKYKESIDYYQKVKAIAPDWAWGLGITYAQMGRRAEARKVAEEFADEFAKGTNDFGSWGIAEIYAALGDKDQMFKWLQTAYQQRNMWIGWIRVQPNFARYRDDPRHQDLLRRMKLPL